MTFDYKLENFISKPSNGDQRLVINDKNDEFISSITPDISHYFVKNNCLIIKITNKNDLILSFENRFIAQQALEKLDYYKKIILSFNGEYSRSINPTFNILNRNMPCKTTTQDYELATDVVVQQKPLSRIDVIYNGLIHVYCGYPGELNVGCYFISPDDKDDITKSRRNDGDVEIGDQLYWIGSVAGFELSDTNQIDLNYLM